MTNNNDEESLSWFYKSCEFDTSERDKELEEIQVRREKLFEKHIGLLYPNLIKVIPTQIKDLQLAIDEFMELWGEYLRTNDLIIMYPRPKPYKEVYMFEDMMKKISTSGFYKELKLSKNDTINGYQLYDIDKTIMTEGMFLENLELWNSKEQPDHNEFIKEYDETACADWSKIDEYGESFKGAWEEPEGSDERENAWNITRKQNGETLWKLPYPKKFILETIQMGCNNRRECVRYSNFICHWMKCKLQQMEK
jgi:hypothetical protein